MSVILSLINFKICFSYSVLHVLVLFKLLITSMHYMAFYLVFRIVNLALK